MYEMLFLCSSVISKQIKERKSLALSFILKICYVCSSKGTSPTGYVCIRIQIIEKLNEFNLILFCALIEYGKEFYEANQNWP
jgi:hypothetical protein